MRKTYITAIVIAILIVGWLASGQLNKTDEGPAPSLAVQNRTQSTVDEESAPTRVRVDVLRASEQSRVVKVRGRTENKRTVDVKVEAAGRIVSRPVERGTQVNAGALLCELSMEDRTVALTEAREALNQAQIEYEGALSLKEKGYNSDAAIAGAKARLATAKANLNRRELDLDKIKVRAPFDGIVENVAQEVGDFVTSGDVCATVIDLDPMLLVGRVSEKSVVDLELKQLAQGILANGDTISGPITFIGQQSDPSTRTYGIEIQIANEDYRLRSGLTTEIRIPVDSVLAQKISPALFSLDDQGAIGVRTIDGNNMVEFHLIEVLADDVDGVWVTGLPNLARVITVGQELVSAGERVDPIFAEGSEATLSAGLEPGEDTDAAEAQRPGPQSAVALPSGGGDFGR